MSQGRPTGVKPARLGPRLVAGEARDGGGGRNSSSGDQMAGGGQLRDAEDPARRVVRSVMPGAIYIDGGELKGGGRSSGNSGDGAIGHGREHPWVFRVRRSAENTLVMLGRADELRSMELVGRGGGELRRRWGTGLEQEREQERRGNRSMSSLWLQSASQWARGRPGDGESGRRSSMPVGEDGGDGVTAGLLVFLGVVGRMSRSRQSFLGRR